MPENFEYYIKNFPWVRVGTAVNWFRYITDIEPEVKRASTLSQFSIPVSFLINLNPLYRNFSNNALKYYYQLYFSYSRVFSDGLSQCFASFLIPLILWTCSDFRLNPFVSHFFTFPLFFHRCVSKTYQSFLVVLISRYINFCSSCSCSLSACCFLRIESKRSAFYTRFISKTKREFINSTILYIFKMFPLRKN